MFEDFYTDRTQMSDRRGHSLIRASNMGCFSYHGSVPSLAVGVGEGGGGEGLGRLLQSLYAPGN